MKKFLILAVSVGIAVLLPSLGLAAGNKVTEDEASSTEKVAISALVAQVKQQKARDHKIAALLAPVKSRSDLLVYIQNSSIESSPLAKLSPGARHRFLASLTFNENGLTGYKYDDLARELNASEIYKLLSLFGAQHTTALLDDVRVESEAGKLIMSSTDSEMNMLMMDDHKGYRCVSRATCNVASSYICMSGC